MIDFQTVLTISQPAVRFVLEHIAASGLIRRGDLERQTPTEIDKGTMDDALQRLKEMHLIEEKESPIQYFNTLYITADGLQALRKSARITSSAT